YAQEGIFSIGIERDPALVDSARRRYADVPACGFVRANLDLPALSNLPMVDAVLMLSVHHHWVQAYGPGIAREMLGVAFRKAARLMIFEGPSRRSRYGRYAPNFVDNDPASVQRYTED